MPALLGAWLRRLRRDCRLTQHDVAERLHFDKSTISRLETGQYRHQRDTEVHTLLTLYGIPEAEHAKYLSWGYPDRDDPDHVPRYDVLMELEPLGQILQCEQALIPDLAQTPEYARAALEFGHLDLSSHHIDRMLGERLRAQDVLRHPRPPHLWMVVEYAACCRPLGGDAVWRRQLEHLLELAQRPNVTLQILGDRACGPAFVRHPFTCLRFADSAVPDVLCRPDLTGVEYSRHEHATERYRKFHDFLVTLAAGRTQTIRLLHELML